MAKTHRYSGKTTTKKARLTRRKTSARKRPVTKAIKRSRVTSKRRIVLTEKALIAALTRSASETGWSESPWRVGPLKATVIEQDHKYTDVRLDSVTVPLYTSEIKK